MTTDEWVARLNALAREMDDLAASLHPTAWAEALRDLNDKWRRLAEGVSTR